MLLSSQTLIDWASIVARVTSQMRRCPKRQPLGQVFLHQTLLAAGQVFLPIWAFQSQTSTVLASLSVPRAVRDGGRPRQVPNVNRLGKSLCAQDASRSLFGPKRQPFGQVLSRRCAVSSPIAGSPSPTSTAWAGVVAWQPRGGRGSPKRQPLGQVLLPF